MQLPIAVESLALEGLTSEELWQRYAEAVHAQEPDASAVELLRNALIEVHLPLVRHIAEHLHKSLPKSIEVDDLAGAGVFGLMDCIRRFDPERGVRFKTYCTTRIRGAILDQLRSQDWVPRLVRLKAGKIQRALARLTGEFGREPTHAELAQELELEVTALTRELLDNHPASMFSISAGSSLDEEGAEIDGFSALGDPRAPDPLDELRRRDAMRHLTSSLSHKERFIVQQYYECEQTMRAIGEMLGITESRVCQIHSNILARLRDLLARQAQELLE